MRNISFDNPYLLLVLIPLLVLILVPIFIAIRKENNSKSVVASLIIHIVLAICITLAISGMVFTSVMTQTQIYVVADVSYSANLNQDQIDEYIRQIEDELPRNSKLGVIVFAREPKILTEMGEEIVSVKEHGFTPNGTAATNIASAINFAVEQFDDDVIKRIVLISDGKQTHSNGNGELVAAVDNAYSQNIYIDAIYMDDNLPEDVPEVQISDVEYAPSIYKNYKSVAKIMIQSNQKTNAILTFSVDSVKTNTMAVPLEKGFNIVEYELPNGSAGEFDYRFMISADDDTATNNNLFDFSQTVTNNMHVLLVSSDNGDVEKLKTKYDDETVIDAYINNNVIPCTVEELCKYDEIVLSSVDVRMIQNYTSFIESIDRVVSRFGKSLVTMGDLKIQNKTEDVFKQLEDMLPIQFGNGDNDPKLFAIVIDTSRSMQNFSRLRIAKQAAVHLLGMLSDNDYVMVVNFWGNLSLAQAPTKATNREDVEKIIMDLQPYQGTMLGTALDEAGEIMIKYNYSEKQIMLISDGMSYSNEEDTPVDVVKKLREHGIVTSVIHPAGWPVDSEYENGDRATLQAIASAGGGKYYPVLKEADLAEIMFNQIQPGVTQSVVTGNFEVDFAARRDPVLEGVEALPNITTYAYGKAKASATTVLTVPFAKSSGAVVKAPLFAYWEYGNGRVSSFTSTFDGDWNPGWNTEDTNRFFTNVMELSVPAQRTDTPYTVSVEFDSARAHVEIVPVTLNPKDTVVVTLIDADGNEVTEQLIFDSRRYFFSFDTPRTGKYQIHIKYTHGEMVFESDTNFNISYSPEYNLFEVFTPSDLHMAIRNRGTVTEGQIPNLEPNESEISTYTVRFTAPLMILSVVLYVIDIMIRKLKISDIKSFFRIKPKKGVGK